MSEQPQEWPELVCVLCGLIVMFDRHGSVGGYPGKCPANAGGEHVRPRSDGAKRAQEIHAAWLKDPFKAPVR